MIPVRCTAALLFSALAAVVGTKLFLFISLWRIEALVGRGGGRTDLRVALGGDLDALGQAVGLTLSAFSPSFGLSTSDC